jgi:orotate phosphoribosyltransferase
MASSPRYPKLVALLKEKSLRFGDFTLASGVKSSFYIDGKMTCMDPQGATLIAQAILSEIAEMHVDAIGGMDMGATPIVGAVAVESYHSARPYPVFVVRKDTKEHGTKKPIEGPIPQKGNVVIIDDVVTTGSSILKAIDAAEAHGCKVVLAISVLDRNAGAADALAAKAVPYRSLVTMADLGL